jgi:zinc-binding in reverse transcriptase
LLIHFTIFFAETGKTRFAFPPLWRVKAPLSVKLFFHALITDKLLTQHMLRRRKIQHIQTSCLMCRQCPSESTLHLFFLCPFAISLWIALQQGRQKSEVSLWCSIIMAACWHLWKQRNNYAFGDTPKSSRVLVQVILHRVCEDVRLW